MTKGEARSGDQGKMPDCRSSPSTRRGMPQGRGRDRNPAQGAQVLSGWGGYWGDIYSDTNHLEDFKNKTNKRNIGKAGGREGGTVT